MQVCCPTTLFDVGIQAWMICLPAAVSKTIFDLVWDFFRDKTRTIAGERTGVESGIELHHSNEITPTPEDKVDPETPQSEPETEILQAAEIVSLASYLKEKFDKSKLRSITNSFVSTFPIFTGTLRRLPYALLPFALSQFILVEALSYTGWINVFSNWLAIVVGFSLPATVFVVGVVSIVLCNCSGTNIGATILLVKVLRHPNFADRAGIPPKLRIGGMLALAVGSNIGAVSFTFSASLAGILTVNFLLLITGLLWRGILLQKGIKVTGVEFVKWNMLPLLFMTAAGCAIALAVVIVAPD